MATLSHVASALSAAQYSLLYLETNVQTLGQAAHPFALRVIKGNEMEYISLLVDNLNALLHTLHIHLSIPIESPTDLTPSLLLVILESLLGARIPVEAYTYPHTHTTTGMTGFLNVETINRIQSMKLFLGVLEHDVLGMDVGLSDVDPRRLARGEWEEMVYVAEVLCWVGMWLREEEEEEDETTAVFGGGELEKGFVEEEETIGLGIYESCSPSLLSNDLASDLELNTSFTLRVPFVSGSATWSGAGG